MVPKFANVVIAKHPNWKGLFVFKVSSGIKLEVGEWILCDTARGPGQIAQCVTPSFEVGEWQVENLWGVTIKDLKPVTAYLKPVAIAIEKEAVYRSVNDIKDTFTVHFTPDGE